MQFQELIDELAERAQVQGGIEIDVENRCFMAFDGMGVVIQGMDEVNQVSLLSAIGEPPPERLTELYRTLLEANHLFQGTFGATLSLDSDDGAVYVCKCLPYAALDGDAFLHELENFVNAVETWREYIVNFRTPAPDQPESGTPGGGESLGDSFLRV